jgi:hypothetical protein
MGQAINYIKTMLSPSLFSFPMLSNTAAAFSTLVLICFFMLIEWLGRDGQFAIEAIKNIKSRPLRWSFYFFIIFLIGAYMQTTETPFIYFQF